MWKRLIAMSLAFGMAATAPPAFAQTSCGPHDRIIEKLGMKYGENNVGRGLQSATRLIEVWRSKEKGSWTILLVRPDGLTCIMASGMAWVDEQPKMAGMGL